MAKMGRPTIEISQPDFEKLCGLQCTEEEIASFFNCSVDTITNWCKKTYDMTFSEIYKRKSQMGKMSLRRTQWKLAEKSVPMAIFLGKQYLGQKDIVENVDDTQMKKVEELLSKIKDEANDN